MFRRRPEINEPTPHPSLRAQRSDPSHHEIVRRRSPKSGRVVAASMTRGVSGRGAIKSAVKRRQNRGLLCYADKKQRAQRSGKPALSYPRKRVSSGTRRGGARLAPGGSSKQPKIRQRRGILDARVRGHDTRETPHPGSGCLVQGDRPQAGANSQWRSVTASTGPSILELIPPPMSKPADRARLWVRLGHRTAPPRRSEDAISLDDS